MNRSAPALATTDSPMWVVISETNPQDRAKCARLCSLLGIVHNDLADGGVAVPMNRARFVMACQNLVNWAQPHDLRALTRDELKALAAMRALGARHTDMVAAAVSYLRDV